MAKLIYSALTSLDLYVADESGNFDWAAPDEDVHTVVNDLMRSVGTQLYGRRMYEVLVAWESPDMEVGQPPHIADFARMWRGTDKIVYSHSLEAVSSARTRIERDFDPDTIRRLKATADRDISIGGPDLAAQALRTGLVDEIHLFLSPIIVGGGNAAVPGDVRVPLELIAERRFGTGVVHMGYRVISSAPDRKLAAVRRAVESSFPTADIETMIEESTESQQPHLHG
jgi:dihydrofolate reductase